MSCYVDKEHYDRLLDAYGKLKLENDALKKAWSDLKDCLENNTDKLMLIITEFSDSPMTMNKNIGKLDTLLSIRYDIKRLEDTLNV